MSNLIELVGYACIVAFLYLMWPPAALLATGLLLVVWANVRAGRIRTKKPAAAPPELRQVA